MPEKHLTTLRAPEHPLPSELAYGPVFGPCHGLGSSMFYINVMKLSYYVTRYLDK
jgi:hypothetical protein